MGADQETDSAPVVDQATVSGVFVHMNQLLRIVGCGLFISLFCAGAGLVLVLASSLKSPKVFWPRPVSAQPTAAYKTYGMNFSPFIDGQDPNLRTEISEAQILARMQIIANNTVWVRSFGCTHGLEKVGSIAHSLGLKAAVGAWLSNDTTANNQEISNLILKAMPAT